MLITKDNVKIKSIKAKPIEDSDYFTSCSTAKISVEFYLHDAFKMPLESLEKHVKSRAFREFALQRAQMSYIDSALYPLFELIKSQKDKGKGDSYYSKCLMDTIDVIKDNFYNGSKLEFTSKESDVTSDFIEI